MSVSVPKLVTLLKPQSLNRSGFPNAPFIQDDSSNMNDPHESMSQSDSGAFVRKRHSIDRKPYRVAKTSGQAQTNIASNEVHIECRLVSRISS